MKSERRHELQTNTLADTLGENLEKHGDRVKLLGAATIAIFALVFAVLYISGRRTEQQAGNWAHYFMAVNAFDNGITLETVSEDFDKRDLDNTTPGHWTMQSLADLKLQSGASLRFRNKETALKDLEIAKANYEKVKASGASDFLKLRATFGLAQVHETLCNAEQAKKYYTEVKSMAGEDSAFGKIADASIARVEKLAADGWFVWFKDQEVVKPEPVNVNLPDSLEELPDRPNLEFGVTEPIDTSLDPPATPEGTTPEGTTPEGTTPEGKTPEGTTPEGKTPEGTKPEGKTPEGTTPEGTKPEGTTPEGKTPEGTKPEGTQPKEPTPPAKNAEGDAPAPSKPAETKPAETKTPAEKKDAAPSDDDP